jgi:heterodisulfide reductase subunit B
MKFSYYPGCTLKNHARNFDDSTISSMEKLDVEMEELDRWNCCGTVYSMASDDLMKQMAPIRNLIRVREAENSELVTGCAMCYNTIKRANERMRADDESLKRMNEVMYLENVKYEGDVEVVHLLEMLRDKIGFDKIKKSVKKPLEGLRVASYYGCMLVRPKEIAFDDCENPTIMDDLVENLGADQVDFAHKTECCGAYQTVNKPEIIADRTHEIISDAQREGAEVIAVTCPLCAFNLDQRQQLTAQKYSGFKHMPVIYFTQLMAIALDCDESSLKLDLHHVDPAPVLKDKGLL